MTKYTVVKTTARTAKIEADSYEEAVIASRKILDSAFKRDGRYDKQYVVAT